MVYMYLICKGHDTKYLLILCCVVIAVLVAQGTNNMPCVLYHRGTERLDCSLPKSPQSPLTQGRSTQTSQDASRGHICQGKEMLQNIYEALLALLFSIALTQRRTLLMAGIQYFCVEREGHQDGLTLKASLMTEGVGVGSS